MASFDLTGAYCYPVRLPDDVEAEHELVEDSSPMISYNPQGAWVDTPENDSFSVVRPSFMMMLWPDRVLSSPTQEDPFTPQRRKARQLRSNLTVWFGFCSLGA